MLVQLENLWNRACEVRFWCCRVWESVASAELAWQHTQGCGRCSDQQQTTRPTRIFKFCHYVSFLRAFAKFLSWYQCALANQRDSNTVKTKSDHGLAYSLFRTVVCGLFSSVPANWHFSWEQLPFCSQIQTALSMAANLSTLCLSWCPKHSSSSLALCALAVGMTAKNAMWVVTATFARFLSRVTMTSKSWSFRVLKAHVNPSSIGPTPNSLQTSTWSVHETRSLRFRELSGQLSHDFPELWTHTLSGCFDKTCATTVGDAW